MRRLVYFAIVDPQRGQGILRKVRGFVAAAHARGWDARDAIDHRRGWRAHASVALGIARAAEDIIVVRGTSHHLAILAVGALVARLRGRVVIVEVPTPHHSAVHEAVHSRFSLQLKASILVLLVLVGPMAVWPFSRVLQCAPEGWWWSLGNRRRTRVLANGIDLSTLRVRRRVPAWPAARLRLLGVANVSFWHGYDRVIRALVECPDVEFTIVGDGEALEDLKALAREQRVQDRVNFTGPAQGAALEEAYETHHVGIASLGLHRKGLRAASELKAREYCAVGMPFIASGRDLGIPDAAPFRYTVSASERVDDVVQTLRTIAAGPTLPPPVSLRHFAEERLGMERAVVDALEGL